MDKADRRCPVRLQHEVPLRRYRELATSALIRIYSPELRLNLVEPSLAGKLEILAEMQGPGESDVVRELQELRLARLDAL